MDDVGKVWFERQYDPDTGALATRITSFSPRCRVAPSFLDAVRDSATLARCTLDGDVLTIRDDYGARFIYRIHWDDYADGGYLAEWPD